MSGKEKAKRSSTKTTQETPEVATVELTEEAQSSIEFMRDAKGIARWSIKVYCPNDKVSLSKALKRVLILDKTMQKRTMG